MSDLPGEAPEPAPVPSAPEPEPAAVPAPALRASDADRERTLGVLRDAAGDGRLTLGELTERIEAAWSAKTHEELAPLTADLVREQPAPAPSGGFVPQPRKARNWLVAVMGGSERKGRWRVASRVNAVAVMGGCEVDLRDAEIEAPEIVITAIAVMGGIEVIVPEGVEVELGGFVLMGGKGSKVRGTPRPGAPRVRVRAFGLMGGISVETPRPSKRDRRDRDDRDQLGGR
jgi:hypothetical protein